MHAGEDESPLNQQQEGVEKAGQMPRRGLHRVEPVGVDHSPSEIITVVTDQPLPRRRQPAAAMAEGDAAPGCLHDQHDHQQEDHRQLRRKDRRVLREAVVPDRRLQVVQADKGRRAEQADDIHRMQRAAVTQPVAVDHRPADQAPEEQLMGDIEAPRRSPAPENRLWQLPVVPGRALIGQQLDPPEDGVEQQNGEGGKDGEGHGHAESDP